MDITPFVERLRQDLTQAVSGAEDATRAAADRLSLALGPAIRLTLMEALSEAAAEITSEMRTGAVEVRLAGRELEFVVEHPAPTPPARSAPPDPAAGPAEAEDADGTTARITLRIPEGIKTRAEELAARDGHSLNTWIVNVLRTATSRGAVSVDIDLSSIPFLDEEMFNRKGRGNRRMTGWI